MKKKAFGSKDGEEACDSSFGFSNCSVKCLAIHTLGQCYWSQTSELCPPDRGGMRCLRFRNLKLLPLPFPHLQPPELSQRGRLLQVIFRKQGKRLEPPFQSVPINPKVKSDFTHWAVSQFLEIHSLVNSSLEFRKAPMSSCFKNESKTCNP